MRSSTSSRSPYGREKYFNDDPLVYNWTYKPDPTLSGQFVPLVCGYPGRHRVTAKALAAARDYIAARTQDYPDGTVWLIGNEIGNREMKYIVAELRRKATIEYSSATD